MRVLVQHHDGMIRLAGIAHIEVDHTSDPPGALTCIGTDEMTSVVIKPEEWQRILLLKEEEDVL